MFIIMIFRPFVISSGFHLSMIALFRIKCRSNALALCESLQFYLPRDGFHKDTLTGDPQGHLKMSASAFHIVHNLF